MQEQHVNNNVHVKRIRMATCGGGMGMERRNGDYREQKSKQMYRAFWRPVILESQDLRNELTQPLRT